MDASKKQREPVAFKSLAELKRFIRPGVEFKTVSHANHADMVGLTRVVTTVQTVGFYSKVKDQPEHPFSTCNHGKGFYTDFGKAGNYIFDGMEKLGAVVTLAEPKSAAQIKNLAESLDLFDFAPGAHSPAEYGKYMIRQSGRFDYDENLDAFYDYEKYGTERMNEEDGMFTDRGYIAYKGYTSIL